MKRKVSVHGSYREWVDIFCVGTAVGEAKISPQNGNQYAIQQLAAEPAEIDASLYLFALCNQIQSMCLNQRGIGCIVDAEDVGRLPEAICRVLGVMVCELINDAGECTHPESAHEAVKVKVMLRRRGTTCLCTISSPCVDPCACGKRGLRRAQQLASEFSSYCLVRSMPDRGTTAIMFDIDLVEQGSVKPTSSYRGEDISLLAENRVGVGQEPLS